jgi:hypothetical protein
MSKRSHIDLSGMGLLITSILIVLKLTGVITWGWWAVTSPLWFFPAVAVVACGIIFGILLAMLCIAVPILICVWIGIAIADQ